MISRYFFYLGHNINSCRGPELYLTDSLDFYLFLEIISDVSSMPYIWVPCRWPYYIVAGQ